MAAANSAGFCNTLVRVLDSTQLALATESADTIKVALYPNSITGASQNFETDVGYNAGQYATANELTGTNYTAGGATGAGMDWSVVTGGLLKYTMSNTSWGSSTIANARGALIYDDTLSGDPGICWINFGADYSTSNGTFLISWHASGIWTIDLVP